MAYSGAQMLMEKLNQLITYDDLPIINHPEIISQRPQFQLLYEELDNPLFKTLFINHYHHHQHLQKVTDLRKRFKDATHEAQYVIDLFLSSVHFKNNNLHAPDGSKNEVSVGLDGKRSFKSVLNLFLSCLHIRKKDFNQGDNGTLNLDDVRRSFNLVKAELTSMNMNSSPTPDTTLNQSLAAAAPVSCTRNSQGSKDEIIVGLDGDVELIRDKLVEDLKKVDVVSIVGMGGIGKTTLANKVFNDAYVKYHFHVRVWVSVSQTYNRRDVLIQILKSIDVRLDLEKDDSDSRFREMVHKHLMGKRYLIVIDDIWDIETWDDLKVFFPCDYNGSRILLTTRLTEVAKHANSGGLVHHVGYLNKQRSWELLYQKVFHGDDYPEWSYNLGMKIGENCKGLPLAVAVFAGVLAKEALSEKFWVEIAESTGSYIVGDQNACLETLGLSYNHLPLYLRECFLYLGGFPEDYEFQVKHLIWLWLAEGFIEHDGIRSLEDIATGYLMDLIDRNLVIVTDRKSNRDVKACKVHDLVRELCLKNGNEEGFFNQFPNDVTTPPYKPVRMFVDEDIQFLDFPYLSVKNLRSIMWFSRFSVDITRYFNSFVLLRVLDLPNHRLNGFPEGMKLLVHLRYLAIYITSKEFPSSICKFWNLQTLIYTARYGNKHITLPGNISDLVNLRHLWTRGRIFFPHSIERQMNLQTILGMRWGDGVHNLLKCFPYLKELECATNKDAVYGFRSLTYLENLKLTGYAESHITLPATLKTLTVCFLQWGDMSIIQSLPNLQVLKLKSVAFDGSCWNTDGQVFPQLKFLRLNELAIKHWKAYNASFPCLRQLEILYCHNLEEIPLEIGEIQTIELIKIKGCRHSVGESARRIQQEQHDLGNYDLKIDVSDDIS